MARHSFAGAPAETALSTPINTTAVTLAVGTTSGWPDSAVGEFVIVVDPGTSSEEKMLCSGYTSTTVDVDIRGYDGTTPASHGTGAVGQVVPCLDATQFDLHDAFVAANGTILPGNSAVGDSADTGSSDAPAAADHKHGREVFSTSATASQPGDTQGPGSSGNPARGDHKHGRESYATIASSVGPLLPYGGTASTSAVGDSESPGTANSPARSDHLHGREAFGTSATASAPGDSEGPGSAVTPSRSDHVHGREAAVLPFGTMGAAYVGTPAGQPYTIAGTITPTTNSAGGFSFNYPGSGFPNAVYSVVFMIGDNGNPGYVTGIVGGSGIDVAKGQCFISAGTPMANTTVRINYIAVGC